MRTNTLLPLIALLAGCDSDAPGKSYVLVHGAWMGGGGWDPVAAHLRDAGATVRTLDLPAHGADTTPAGAATLAGYVQRVEAELPAEPVILVGHSMAGVVLTQVAENRPDDIASLVYIAAYVPVNGQSLLDLAMQDHDTELPAHLQFNADGTVGIEQTAFPALFCADCEAPGTAALTAGYRVEPGMPLGTPVATGAAFAGVRKTYFRTAQDRVVSPVLQTQMLAATPMSREVTFDSSHVPLLSQPEAVAEALLDE